MARHEACPSTMTVESLADWIKSNKVDVINHSEKFPLTEEEIHALQKDSTLASMAIDKLKDTLKYFTELIKKGTPWDSATENHRPVSVTVPPTKGVDTLEKNRKFACKQLEDGYKEEITSIYLVPWPDMEKMVAMDITGEEWSKYSRGMSKDEVMQHGRPILSAAQELRQNLADSGIEIEKVEGNVVHMKVTDKKGKGKNAVDKQPPLSEEEKEELEEGDQEDEDKLNL
jgi:hypothetical protein